MRGTASRENLRELERSDARRQPVLDDLVHLGEKGGAQDDDRCGDSRSAKLDPLVERRDTQHGHSGLDGVARDLNGTVPISVRLDHQKDAAAPTDSGADGA